MIQLEQQVDIETLRVTMSFIKLYVSLLKGLLGFRGLKGTSRVIKTGSHFRQSLLVAFELARTGHPGPGGNTTPLKSSSGFTNTVPSYTVYNIRYY